MFICHGRRSVRASFFIFMLLLLGAVLTGCGGGGGSDTSDVLAISGFSPASGGPSTQVTITGSGFTHDTAITLDGKPVMVDSVTSTQLVVNVGDMADTKAPFEATGGGATVRSKQDFSFLNDLYGVALTPTGFMAVGDSGTLLASSDGSTWTAQASGTSRDLHGIVSANGQTVLVGDGVVMTSADGTHWTERASPTQHRLYATAASSVIFVAVGDDGTIITSPDGVTWSNAPSPTTQPLLSIVWSGAQFLASGDKGVLLTSSDGVNWSLTTFTLVDGISPTLAAVAWGNNTFVVAGALGPLLMSPDASSWVGVVSPTKETVEGMTWGFQFVAVGDKSTVLRSADGLNWTAKTLDLQGDPNLNSVAPQGHVYVAVGQSGTVVTTSDGTDWVQRRGG